MKAKFAEAEQQRAAHDLNPADDAAAAGADAVEPDEVE